MNNELVSIIMPTYNVESFVCDAIKSIQIQTYHNWELIVYDDCSTDRTYEICIELSKNDDRIKVFRNQVNSKIEKTLNNALKEVKGKYVARMDGDDISEPDRIEKMKDFLDKNPKISLVGTNTITIDVEGNEIGRVKYPSSFENIKRVIKYQSPILHIWMTYKSLYDELAGYRVFYGAEDYDFLLRIISNGYEVANIKNYYGYRVRINRVGNSTSSFGLKKLKSKIYVYKLYRQRKNSKRDNYSEEKMRKYIKSAKVTEDIFNISTFFLQKAINSDILLKKLFFTFLSFISPYQVYYFYTRVMFKKKCKS